jgi:hypothetical protein
MPQMVTQVTDHFALAHFERALQGFRPPAPDFDPAGAWVNCYDIWECSQGMAKLGALRIERTPLDGGRVKLDVTFRKTAKAGIMRAQMSVECLADELSTPVRWQAQTLSHDAGDAPIEDTLIRETGELADGQLRVRIGQTTTPTPVTGPVALDWCLFDAVQRLPGEALGPLSFTLVDRLSRQVKPDQRLTFRSAPTVELGGKRVWREEKQELERGTVYRPVTAREGAVPVALRTYDQTGWGILPIVYWVDASGRLLFVLSGLFGYVYNAEAQP